jgi:hypothetical protein
VDTSHARLTSITNPHRVAVRRDAIHAQIVSEPVPEHQRDTLVAGRVPGRPDLREHHEVLIVPYMTRFRDACGGVRCDLRSAICRVEGGLRAPARAAHPKPSSSLKTASDNARLGR